MPFWDI